MNQVLRNTIIKSEDKFVKASRLINGIICTIDAWKRKYGVKNYCNGFKEKRWISCQVKWVSRLHEVLNLLNEIEITLNSVQKVIKKQEIDSNIIVISLERINQIKNNINLILKELSIINIIIDAYDADDPVNKYIKVKENNKYIYNINYKEFLKIIRDNDKQRLVTLCTNINKLVGIHSIYHTIIKNISPLIINKTSKRKENKKISSKTLKDQLLLYKKKQEQEQEKKNNKDHFKNWVTTQYENFNSIPTADSNLLEDSDLYGICQLPIILVNSYVNKDNKKILNHIGYRLSHVLGNYLIIENALLLGIHKKQYENSIDVDKAWNIIKNYINNDSLDISNNYKKIIVQNKLVPIGPLVKKETHFYALLVPSIFIQYKGSGFTLNAWDIKI